MVLAERYKSQAKKWKENEYCIAWRPKAAAMQNKTAQSYSRNLWLTWRCFLEVFATENARLYGSRGSRTMQQPVQKRCGKQEINLGIKSSSGHMLPRSWQAIPTQLLWPQAAEAF